MCWKLQDPGFPVILAAGDFESAPFDIFSVGGVQVEVAVVIFQRLGTAVETAGKRMGAANSYRHSRSPYGTGKSRNEHVRSVGVVMFASRIFYPEKVAGILQDDVLEANARPDEGHVVLAGVPDTRSAPTALV